MKALTELKILTDPKPREIKSLQKRFEELQTKLQRAERPKPLVIELLGSPRAGKSSTREILLKFLQKTGFRVHAPFEGASQPDQAKLKEDLIAFNGRTTAYALHALLGAVVPHNQLDVLILDRGLLDSACWFEALRRLGYARAETCNALVQFVGDHEWLSREDFCFLFTCDESKSQARQSAIQLTMEGNLGTSSEILTTLREVYLDDDFLRSLLAGTRLDVARIDTSADTSPRRVAYSIAKRLLEWFEDMLDPEVMTVPRKSLPKLGFHKNAASILAQLSSGIRAVRREKAEHDSSMKQLVAYGFVRKGKNVLSLHRDGAANRPELRGLRTIGVGGHLEQSDWLGSNDVVDALKKCLRRELEEEFIFNGEPVMNLVGVVNDESNEAGRYHLSVWFEIELNTAIRPRAEAGDQEFKVDKGTFQFSGVSTLTKNATKFDPWSQHVIHGVFGGPEPAKGSGMIPFQ